MSARSSTTIARRLVLALAASAALLVSCGKAAPTDEEANTVRIAAASDLTKAFEEIAKAYEKKTGKKTKVTFGASGNLSKQIIDGAPFDVFAAANLSFVDEVVAKAGCQGDTKTQYARGHLVVYSKHAEPPKDIAELADARFTKVAIANPEHAPYGKAAKEALEKKGVWEAVKPKLTYGENIAQTMQFAETGNVDVALVALSLAVVADGKYVEVDQSLHNPLDQALVVCAKPERRELAKGFADFVGSPEGRTIMKKYGFLLPGETLPVAEN